MPAQPQSKSKKSDPIQRELKRLSHRMEQGFRSLKSGQQTVTQRQLNLEKRQDNLEKRQNNLEKGQQKLEKGQQKLEKRQFNLEKNLRSLRSSQRDLKNRLRRIEKRQLEYEAKMKAFWKSVVNLFNGILRRIEIIEEENRKFRDQIYTMIDGVMKKYDAFTIEKQALAACDDSLEGRVEVLEQSDGTQNRALQELDTRVTSLEALPLK